MKNLKRIIKFYNINVVDYELLAKGFASRKWIITDSNHNKYVLKEVDKQPINRLKKILNIQSQLNELSPKIIETKKNKLYSKCENSYYYMCEYIENEPWNILYQARNIGTFLAKLHSKMADIKNEHTSFLKVEDNVELLNEYLNYHKLYNHTEYVKIIKYKLTVLNKLKMNNIDFNNLTKQIIHGDFYGDNILYTESSYKIIDFDQCCEFYKEYEILRGMFMLSDEVLIKKDKLLLMNEFIKGYYVLNEIISPEDAYNLYLYIQANSLSSIRPSDYEKEEKRKFAQKRFRIIKFLIENQNEIIKILNGGYK